MQLNFMYFIFKLQKKFGNSIKILILIGLYAIINSVDICNVGNCVCWDFIIIRWCLPTWASYPEWLVSFFLFRRGTVLQVLYA